MVTALLKEMEIQQKYTGGEIIKTVYLGGGTPSLTDTAELKKLVGKIRLLWTIDPGAEITLETNPDDITEEKLEEWKKAGINRLSIGIQSFFDEDLKWMNRAHTARQSLEGLEAAKIYFDNLTIDLIYGTPFLDNKKWQYNVDKAVSLGISHLSCYALTVETKTPLYKMISQGKTPDINPDKQSEQFLLLMQWLEEAGYEHYEISNFARRGFRSRHNSSYWQGEKYLGIGPSAHSFDGISRQWNISNNNQYIDSITKGAVPFEKETLTPVQKLNEYIMTSLRTIEGLELAKTGKEAADQLIINAEKYIDRGLLQNKAGFLCLTKEGKLLADGIAADLFFS